jgi:hypothetical protein
MSDPFEEATQSNGASTATSVQDRLIDSDEQNAGRIEDRLFGGESLPSVFTKKHDVGDWIEGVIKDIPFEKHSRFFVEDGVGELKFWGADGKPTAKSVDADGKALRPVMDLVLPLSTTYRLTPAQLETRGLDASDDDGSRGWYMGGGDAEKQFKAAIRKAGIRSTAALVGAKLRAKRTGKVKKGDYASWMYAVEITKA